MADEYVFGTFLDIDSIGVNTNTLTLWETHGAAATNTRTSSYLTTNEINTVDAIGLSCGGYATNSVYIHRDDTHAILKWDFTYSN